jgi:hypothetical protein
MRPRRALGAVPAATALVTTGVAGCGSKATSTPGGVTSHASSRASANPDACHDHASPLDTGQLDAAQLGTGHRWRTHPVQSFSNVNKGSTYVQRSVNLASYAGQTITLKWTGTEDYSLATSFFIDDTALNLS